MRKLIKKLKILEGPSSAEYHTLDGPGLDCIALGQGLLLLPEMKELELQVHGFRFDAEARDEDTWGFTSNEPPIRKLDKLVISTTRGAELIPSLVGMFAKVNNFIISFAEVEEPFGTVPRGAHKVSVQHLALQYLSFRAMSQLVIPLSSVLDPTGLTHLSVGNYGYQHNILELLLPQLGANLTELRFTGGTHCSFRYQVMSFCQNLSCLQFQIILAEVSSWINWAKAWPIAMQIIHHTPQSLRELRLDISMCLNDVAAMDAKIDNSVPDSPRIVRLLSSLSFEALELALGAHPALATLHITISNGRNGPFLKEVDEALALLLSQRVRSLLRLSAR